VLRPTGLADWLQPTDSVEKVGFLKLLEDWLMKELF
jgi:hypothetical protein